MNLHSIVRGAIGAINPNISGTIQVSDGSTVAADGQRVPKYKLPRDVSVQWQPMSSKDLQHVNGLNLNGELRAAYLSGELEDTVRPDNKGGDLITLKDGSVWLSVYVMENWKLTSGWMKSIVQRQMP